MKAKRAQHRATPSSLAPRGGGLPRDYRAFLDDLKARIRGAQVRAALAVNREMIRLYWDIGRAIAFKQGREGWGNAIVERLAGDLQREFPGISGFSASNIWRMRAFYRAYVDDGPILARPVRELAEGTIAAQPARQLGAEAPPEPMASLPWGHNVVLLEHLKEPAQRLWYAKQTIANGWSRTMLEHWIESDLYARQGKAVTNFPATLPPAQSDLARQIVKDPYNFDFLTLHTQALERELEVGLLEHITRFLLELGEGFAFVGRQVPLEVDGRDFYIDLLFYHLTLRCFVVVDLKTRESEPEFAGKMNFYLSTVDDQLRKEHDQPSIGLILCKTRSRVIVEYALRQLARPVGVAQYVTKLTEKLPKELSGKLPTVAQIEAELATRPQPAKTRGEGEMSPTSSSKP